jgi:hypothetical protein
MKHGVITSVAVGMVRLPNSTCKEILLSANEANLGKVFIGGASNVSATNFGYRLLADEAVTINVADSAEVFLYFNTIGDVINYVTV